MRVRCATETMDRPSGEKTIFRNVSRYRNFRWRRGTASAIAVWAAFFAVFLALFAAIFVVFRAVGFRSVDSNATTNTIRSDSGSRVSGPSMAPTLWGPHAEMTCPACQNRWNIHCQPEHRPHEPITCWNCGASVPVDNATELPGDLVQIQPLDGRPLTAGELVAITDDTPTADAKTPNWIVKRVAAVPGQSISHQNGLLFADDKPLAAIDASGQPLEIAVHDDSFRNSNRSWWQPHVEAASIERAGIEQTGRGFVLDASDGPTPWLDYHHFAVHDAMRPDVVRDDVPGNATEVRLLVPVDSLAVTFEATTTESIEIEVAFSIGEATAAVGRKLPPGYSVQRVNSDEAEPANNAALPTVPISIRLISGRATLSNLVVWRPLRYRIDPRDAASQTWPIRLGDDEYYLLGDNVPLSIDSRDWGPIPRRRIVGRIYAVGYDGQ